MSVKENYQLIRSNIERACRRVKRSPDQVQVLAVCKDQPPEKIIEAYGCGIRLLGENRVQEAESHMRLLSGCPVRWHFIGRLQKNKLNKVITAFDLVQSVDGVKTLEHIHKRIERELEVFLEINIGEEASKSGFTVDGLKKAMNYVANLNRVRVTGLMIIPPPADDLDKMRPYFSRLRRLQDEINAWGIANLRIVHLSMGMSHDYEVAVEEGATMVRIGSALFGRSAS